MRDKEMRRNPPLARKISTADIKPAQHAAARAAVADLRLRERSIQVLRVALVVFLFALGSSLSLAQDAPMEISGATTVESKRVVELILNTPGLVVVDTRTKADFESGHIEGAINILDTDITSDSILASVVKSKSSPVLFYCNGVKCGRAAKATVKAVEWGYSKVYYYALGINEWKSVQFPLVTQ